MMNMRFCPECQTERELTEELCEGPGKNGERCGYALINKDEEQVNTTNGLLPAETENPTFERSSQNREVQAYPTSESQPQKEQEQSFSKEVIDGWTLQEALSNSADCTRERFYAINQAQKKGILTLYSEGAEPDTSIYEVIKNLPREHVPEIYNTGRWKDRAYEVSEQLTVKTLADLGIVLDDEAGLRKVVSELGEALYEFSEAGLRHRDLRPSALLVRTEKPLDLVISGFGSACLSEHDLEVVSTLSTSLYMAPEAIAGGVSPASDWWSLGMILLEQLTTGACFKGTKDPHTFLINVLASGVDIPKEFNPALRQLFRGLLMRDHLKRWQWPEVKEWLVQGGVVSSLVMQEDALHQDNEVDSAALSLAKVVSAQAQELVLGEKSYTNLAQFALAASEKGNWAEALDLLNRGDLATWMRQHGASEEVRNQLHQIARELSLHDDFKLMLVLKLLNPDIPLVIQGEIITPQWLQQHPKQGFELISLPIYQYLEAMGVNHWSMRLHERIDRVHTRAANLGIKLNKQALQVHLLSSSHAQLAVLAQEQYLKMPDANSAGLLSLIERRIQSNEDLIVVLSAEKNQFKSIEALAAEVKALAHKVDVSVDEEALLEQAQLPRLELYQMLNDRTEGLAVTGIEELDAWMQQYRLEKRLPLSRLLVLLAFPKGQWVTPEKQQYVSRILDFFEKKVTISSLAGPLVRMRIGRFTPRVDLIDFDSDEEGAEEILNRILERTARKILLPTAFKAKNSETGIRLTNLERESNLYKRDTGVDGLYMGFPFLLFQEPNNYRLPRISPVLLWPVTLSTEIGLRHRTSLAFDTAREEVRLNPALENILGRSTYLEWVAALEELMMRSTLSITEVMQGFSQVADAQEEVGDKLYPLPVSFEVPAGEARLISSSVIFHVNFIGQAIGEELRQLKMKPFSGTALETALRLTPPAEKGLTEIVEPAEADRYLTVPSDPSQEGAVFRARTGTGLLMEGPPGTGKSQSIVNIVSDSIGQGKNVLIVCQKRAALEVVHKRLIAEGLGGRSIMVSDTFADRETVIRGVREQLDGMRWIDAGKTQHIKIQRGKIAEQITQLEGELDRYHSALHTIDEQTALTYRELLAELIELEKAGVPLELPMMRPQLKDLDKTRVSDLEGKILPVFKHWLPAHFEGSALQSLQPFENEIEHKEQFKEAFHNFFALQEQHWRLLEEYPTSVQVQGSPTAYEKWLETYAVEILNIDEQVKSELIRWVPLFQTKLPEQEAFSAPKTVGDNLVQELRQIRRKIEQSTSWHWHAEYSPKIAEMDDSWVAELERQASELLKPQPWYSILNIKLHRLKKLLTTTLQTFGETEPRPEQFSILLNALRLEQEWRPVRKALQDLCYNLKTPPPSAISGPELKNMTLEILTPLQQVQEWSETLNEFPDVAVLTRALRTGDRTTLSDLFTHYEVAISHEYSRLECHKTLKILEPYIGKILFAECWYPFVVQSRPSIGSVLERARAAGAIGDVNAKNLPLTMEKIKEALPQLDAYLYYRDYKTRLAPTVVTVMESLSPLRKKLQKLFELGELEQAFNLAINREARLAWKELFEERTPELSLERRVRQKKIDELEQADLNIRQLNREMLTEAANADGLGNAAAWEDITRLRGDRARRLREFVERGTELGLMKLRPVWLMNPDVASRVLPLKAGLFDLVVYDEASQMPVEYALPTLFRGKKVVVSGDEKQMPPTSFFSAQVEMDEEDMLMPDRTYGDMDDDEWDGMQDDWNRREIQDCPDLLQLARSVLPGTTLQIHYRSAYKELIAYSNAAFYNSQLNIPVRHPEDVVLKAKPIELIQIDGNYTDQQNVEEAKQVIAALIKVWKQPGERPSIGIATFNKKQAGLIENMIAELAYEDEWFRDIYGQEQQRLESGEDMSIFVKNVENVQGDERDVIIFSTTFGRNQDGIFYRRFGVLGQVGGERRLNVAITRAKKKIIMVTSMPIQEVSDMLTTQRGPRTPRDYLQAYLEYARLITAGEFKTAETLLKRMGTLAHLFSQTRHEKEDGFADEVERFLETLNVDFHRLSGDDAFKLDFAIKDPHTGLYTIGIECDAPSHPLLAHARAREIWRPSVLQRVMPHIHRVSSQLWYKEAEREKARLQSVVEQALGR